MHQTTRLVAALGALALLGCGAAESPRTVLFVSLDTTRADAMTFRDPQVAPRLSELAERGTIFDQAISGSSWTLPAHSQMFTGQPPALHAVLDDDVVLDGATPLLTELLEDAGFFTAGIFSGLYLDPLFGFGRGFQEYVNAIDGGQKLAGFFRRQADEGDAAAGAAWNSLDIQSHRDISSARIVERAGRLIAAAADQDLFLFTHFFDPHYDYIPPAPYDTRFDPDYQGDLSGAEFYMNPRIFDADRTPLALPPRDLEHLQALYLGELAWTDEHVGQLLDLLEEHQRTERAWVVIVGDHGEEFFEHGGWGHRVTLFDEQVRVPMLIVPPPAEGLTPPRDSDLQVTLSDVLPTLLDGLGLPPSEAAAGRSLMEVLRGGTLPALPALSSLRSRPITDFTDGATKVEHMLVDSLRTPTSKLIRRSIVREGSLELADVRYFDLEQDPGELNPVTDPADPRLREAYGALEAEYARLGALYDRLPHAPDSERRSLGQKWFAKQLEKLGYADDSDEALNLPWGLRPAPPLPLPLGD